MPRFCTRCNRDVHDPKEHAKFPVKLPDGQERMERECLGLVLVADQASVDLITGKRRVHKRYVPDTPQRTRQNNARYAHKDALVAQDRNAA